MEAGLISELLLNPFAQSGAKTSSVTDAQKVSPATDSTPVPLAGITPRLALVQAESDRLPRQWTEQARLAHAFLSHAMEYLADSRDIYCKQVNDLNTQKPEAQAMIVLSEAKRRIYLDCPIKERRNNSLVATFRGYERRKKNQN